MSASAPSDNHRKGRLARWPLLHGIAAWLRRTLLPSQRAIDRLRADSADSLLQPFSDTCSDRHPALFKFARLKLDANPAPLILSYGCSSGEEAFTLLDYVPRAKIDAIDINPRLVRQAQRNARRRKAERIDFVLQGRPPGGRPRYDAIFCLSVLRHGDLERIAPDTCAHILPFSRFAETIAGLDAILVPGGYLYIWGSNFRFADTPHASNYVAVDVPGMDPHPGPVYGADDRLIDCNGNSQFAYRKLR